MSNSTQFTPYENYDVNNMVFDIKKFPIPNTTFEYRRVFINTVYPNGNTGSLILPTAGELFSFGLRENIVNEKLIGHSMGISLYSKEKPTEEQEKWVETFNDIVEHCKKFLLENKVQLGKKSLHENNLEKFNPIYRKTDDNDEFVPGFGPTLSVKLIESIPKSMILTKFEDMDTRKKLDPMRLLAKHPDQSEEEKRREKLGFCNIRAAIRIESIFVGAKDITLQVKLHQVLVKRKKDELVDLFTDIKPVLEIDDMVISNPDNDFSNPLSSSPPNFDDPINDSDEEKPEAPKNKQKVVRKKR